MQIATKSLRKTINKAFLKETVDRAAFNHFKSAFGGLLNTIKSAEIKEEHEEHFKNLLAPFLKETGFGDYYINTNVRIDLAIHTGGKLNDPVGVMLEVKRPSNKQEMITGEHFNRKALHEAVLYYLEQRIEQENEDLKQVVITDTINWFVFDAQEFERCFYRPSALKKVYHSWKSDRKVSSNNDFMYDKIADFIANQDTTIRGLHLDLQSFATYLKAKEDSEPEKKLIPLFKFFSPTQLLKEPFANDSNTLNREFYKEFLYILGLEETTRKNTRYIERAAEEDRHPGSFIENIIRILDTEDHLSSVREPRVKYGTDRGEQLFNVAMELSIIWMNRVLFLKLLEAQLFRYHRQDKKFKFLKSKTIDGFDELNKLFFQVLARREADRTADINEKFGHIPYLNSSLFDPASLEHQSIFISNLDDKKTLPVYARSVLKERRGDEINTLEYLFEFLDAYDFAAEGGEEIHEERKTLINASVLGLIFEKINGYKDGSFFTPGFITEYMARETLRKAVTEKFNEVLGALSPSPQTPLQQAGEGLHYAHPSPAGGGRTEDGGGWKLPDSLIEAARHLRKNQTDAEQLIWKLLRNRQLNGYKFRRQHPIKPGFVLDFYCAKEKLAIEVDGGYHDTGEQQAADAERTDSLNEMGIRVIRFRNEEVLKDTESVLHEIAGELENPGDSPSPQTPFQQAGEGLQYAHPSPAGGGRTEDGGDSLSFTQIYNHIGRDISIEKANKIVNSITICDPAVGSGHFLVSCLNELLAIKSDLGILCDHEGKWLRNVNVAVENDELIVTYSDEELFEYDVAHTWHGHHLAKRKIEPTRQRIQKALFHEKRHIIENGLFGVDINANSVKICRLRLWIELLKNTYYTEGSNYRELEVLPNIDINIKTGNSLVSRFDLDSDLSSVFNHSDHSLEDYKAAVRSYKHTGNRSEKRRLQQLIDDIKDEYSTTLLNNDPIYEKLSRQRGRLELMHNADLFGDKKFSKKAIKKQEKKVKKLEQKKEDQERGAFYDQAFEWRFEFPEVLDEEGQFLGFDVVIGNPPYIRQEELGEFKTYFKSRYEVYNSTADIYTYFFELGHSILEDKGWFSMITSNKFMRTNYGKELRNYLSDKQQIEQIIDFGELPVFKEAATFPAIFITQNQEVDEQTFDFIPVKELQTQNFQERAKNKFRTLDNRSISGDNWSLAEPIELDILEKMREKGIELEDYIQENIYRGLITGYNKAFVIGEKKKEELIDEDPKSVEIIKPVLKGNDIRFYQIKFKDIYLIVTKIDVDINRYSAVKNHLDQYKGRLKKRYDQGKHYWELRACDYYDEFETSKIIYPDIAKESRFTLDTEGYYLTNTSYFIPTADKYVLGILNSKLVFNYYKRVSSVLGDPDKGGRMRWFRQHVSGIPIVDANEEVKKRIESLVDQILTAKKDNTNADTSEQEAQIDRLVYELYGLSEEEIAVVENSI